MIVREGHYGWGILAVPIHRASRKDGMLPPEGRYPVPLCPVTDLLSWRRFFLCCAATFLLIAGALPLHRPAPPVPARNKIPVELAVRLRAEVPEALPPTLAEQPAAPPAIERPRETRKKEMPRTMHRKTVESAPPMPPKNVPAAPPVAAPPLPAEKEPRAEVAAIDLPLPPAASRRPRAAIELLPPAPKRSLRTAAPEVALDAQPLVRQRSPEVGQAGMPRQQEKVAIAMAADIELRQETIRGKKIRTAETPAPRSDTRAAAPARAPAIDLQPPAPIPRPTPAAAPAEKAELPAGGSISFAFLDRIAPAELDRSLLVSLNRLRTCIDPRAETKLKTRLATLLSRPALCRSGGVVFDVLNPESAYSVHIDLYNYERIEFPDRCAALRQAVDCFEARR